MSDEDLKAELERLKAENEALKKRRSSSVSMKVSEKGAVSVYGLGRFIHGRRNQTVHCRKQRQAESQRRLSGLVFG
jgi:hypothetical protein